MHKNRFTRAGLGALLSMALVVSACGDDKEPKKTKSAQQLVNEGKQLIAQKKYQEAELRCLTAEERDDTLDEAKYCVMAANVGALVNSVSAIISLVASQLSPADAYAPAAGFDVKQILGTVLADIEQQMANIDVYAYKLAGMDNPKFQIDDFPLGLDVSDLLSIAGSTGLQVDDNLTLNLKGTWDSTEVLILGAAMNSVQGVLDYLLAHKLKLDELPSDFDISTEFFAQFLLDNPNLLSADEDDTGRLVGSAERKGLKKDVLAALSFLLGRDSDEPMVSPAHDGLREAIKQSAADAEADAVVVWTDADGDGIPETVGLPALDDLQDQILDEDGNPVIEETTFDVPGEPATWEAVIAKGDEIMANIEADGGSAVAIADLLETIRNDYNADAETPSTLRIATLEVPQGVAVSPGSFLGDPKVLADLVPYYFEYEFQATDATSPETKADLAWEVEIYSGGGNLLEKLGMVWAVTEATGQGTNGDFAHFDYDTFPANITGTNTPKGYGYAKLQSYAFGDLTAPSATAVDGEKASEKVPNLFYIGLQNPSIGGVLHVDPALGDSYAEADLGTFNQTLAALFNYYCINTDLAEGDNAELMDVVDNEAQICP